MRDSDDKVILAEEVRRSHCDRKGIEHQCVGVMSVTKDGIELDCKLCGQSTEFLENCGPLLDTAKQIMQVAGIDFHGLDIQQRKRILIELLALLECNNY